MKLNFKEIWRRKSAVIAVMTVLAILGYFLLRFVLHTSPGAYHIPLLAALALGCIPYVYELIKKLFRREFGSDLLGGISIVTSVVMGEYLAGAIIVLDKTATSRRKPPASW